MMRTIMRSTFIDASAALLLLATAAPALAQQPAPSYPGKPIEMTVMFGAGSAADVPRATSPTAWRSSWACRCRW
jgi:tripartite-type tricarboxylate transporter receptor subunit TctC